MMRWLTLALCLLAIAARADDFAAGNIAYAEGRFAEARNAYEKALKTTNGHANLWFNHGNALFRLDEPGRAALSYERALLIQPSHPEAAANLRFIREKTGASIPETPLKEKVWRYLLQPWTNWAAVGIAWIGFGVLALPLLGRRNGSGRWILGTLLVALAGGALGGLHWVLRDWQSVAVVVQARTDARKEPADRATLAQSLSGGSRVRIISDQGAWTYCELPNGERGWIPTGHVERLISTHRS